MASPEIRRIDSTKAIVIPGWAERLNRMMGMPSDNGRLYKDSVWARRCIDLRAHSLSGIPWGIRVGEEEDAEFLDNDALPVALLNEVNQEMNWIELIRATMKDLDIEGRAYWEKVMAAGRVVELRRLNPSTVKNIQDKNEGLVGFEQRLEGSRNATWEREEIVYFHDYNPMEDFGGLGKMETAKESIKADIAATLYLQSFFQNGAIPALILRTEQDVGPDELNKRRRLWDRWFKGVSKALKTAFVDRGLEAQTIGLNVEQLAMQEVRAEARKDICGAFGVPPAIAGAWESATYNAAPEQRRSFYEDAIFPDAESLASVINNELIIPHFGREFTFEWLVNELPFMQEDTNAKGTMLARAVEVGAITPDAFVALMDYPEEYMGTGSEQANPPSAEQADEPQEQERVPVEQNGRVEEIRAVMAEVARNRPMLEKDEIGDVEADLNTWRRKALKRLAQGKDASCTFESKHIPDSLNVAIEELLKGITDEEGVHRVFHNAVLWREREPIYGGIA